MVDGNYIASGVGHMGIAFTQGRARSGLVVVLALATALTMALAIDEAAATGINHGDVVKEVPRANTPEFLDDEVRGHLQVGNRIIVAGSYTQVRDNTFGVVNQPYLAAYDIATGRLDMAFQPELSGPVFALADVGDGTIIAVGKFNTVNGISRKRVVKLNVVDGSVVTAFKANATATVNDVVVAGNRVYFGGGFAEVNGTAREKLAAVDLQTGAVASNFNFPVTEETGYWIDRDPNDRAGAVRALDVTPDGKKLLVVHNSRKVGGQARQSVALIDIDGAPSLLPWKTTNYDYDCQPWFESFIRPLMRDAQFSPDGSYFVAVSSLGNFAPGCDVAVRFPTAGGNGVNPTWVSRMFDTPEAVAITDEAIYVGGHMRWFQQPGTVWTDWGNGNTNTQPANTVDRDQIGAINPANGTALPWDPGASGFRGVLALEATPVGLLAGSDGERFGGLQTFRHALFELPSTTPPSDTTAPNGALAVPTNGQVYNGRVTVTGTASDNKGVAEVYVVVKNTGTNKYLQPDLTWAAAWAQIPSFVHEYRATSTAFGWSGDLPNGNYTVTVRAEDIVGNVDGSPATRSFVVTSGNDTVDPDGDLDVPTPDQAFATTSICHERQRHRQHCGRRSQPDHQGPGDRQLPPGQRHQLGALERSARLAHVPEYSVNVVGLERHAPAEQFRGVGPSQGLGRQQRPVQGLCHLPGRHDGPQRDLQEAQEGPDAVITDGAVRGNGNRQPRGQFREAHRQGHRHREIPAGRRDMEDHQGQAAAGHSG